MAKGGSPRLTVMGTMHEIGYWEGAIDENRPPATPSQYESSKMPPRQSLMLSLRTSAPAARVLHIDGDEAHCSSEATSRRQSRTQGATFPFTSGKYLRFC